MSLYRVSLLIVVMLSVGAPIDGLFKALLIKKTSQAYLKLNIELKGRDGMLS